MKRLGRYTLLFERRPAILGHAAVCGKKEAAGPLARDFDQTFLDSYLNQESWEKAESMLQTEAANLAIRKAGLQKQDINMVFAGDLLNQCISSTFGLRGMDIPFLGQYGACSTMAQTLIMASIMVECGAANYTCAVTSSHFCTAERQFRTPLEYGSQRAPTAQWTATASGSAVLGMSGDIQVRHATVGRIVDLGVTDMTNMGAAMAPAAYDTLCALFRDTRTKPEDYDLIVTGDLGRLGHQIVSDFFARDGLPLGERYTDCGLLLYDIESQDMHCGGSGCGCSASVLCGYLLRGMREGKWNRIIFAPTGALLSPTTTFQGESIPGICHAVVFSNHKEG
jgi:stage V sporulation protein AD